MMRRSIPVDAVTSTPPPVNEPVRQYAPGSPERARLEARLKDFASGHTELTMAVGGERRRCRDQDIPVVMPHDHSHVLGTMGRTTLSLASA
jgi:1-pyrroline-5-carboxylate dehydrogenase